MKMTKNWFVMNASSLLDNIFYQIETGQETLVKNCLWKIFLVTNFITQNVP